MDRLACLPAAGGIYKPQTVADQVAGVLREAISNGTLAPGSVLRQDELAARFGFSRMPVRDALRQLDAEGLVTVHPTKGAFVARMDAAEIGEIFAIRDLLECEALRLSCPHLQDAKLSEAAVLTERMDAEPDVGRWGALNRAFHMALYSGCDNSRLLGMIDAQHGASDRYVRVLLADLAHQQRSQREHGELLAACQRRDADAAVAVLHEHLREGRARLVAAVLRGVV